MMKLWTVVLLVFPLLAHGADLSGPAPLRENLPADALAYLRIPNPWGFLSSPKGSVMDQALRNQIHAQQVALLENAINTNLLSGPDTAMGPLLRLLIHHLRSPVEAVLVLPADVPTPIPNVLVSARLNLDSIDDLNALLYNIAETLPQMRVLNEADADGHAILLADPLPVFLHYDLASRTLRLMGGVSVTAEIFQQTLESLAPAADHPMHALEAQVDASHQGFFAWVDVARTLPLVQFAIPPETALELHKWGLLEARTLALGWGTRNGKGRLKLLLDVPKGGYRQFLPDITSDLSIAAAGAPGVVFALSIPAPQLLQGFEAIAQQEAEPEALQAYLDFKEGFAQLAGFTLEEVLAVFGPETVIFTDEVGEFLAMRINHRERLEKLLDTLVQAFGVEYEARELGGTTYHHLILPSFEPPAETEDQDAPPAPLAGREKTHFYWIEDNGWLVFAQVPQLLMDRQRQQARTPIKQWLAEQQRLDVGSSLLVFSAAIDDTPRHIYYTYLQLLTYLADLAQEKVDIFALPTATDLNLPKEGAYGVQMDVSGSVLDVEFTFENNPLEIFINQQIIGNIALLGVVAAVALPGYVTDED